jgi:hypothetical protein
LRFGLPFLRAPDFRDEFLKRGHRGQWLEVRLFLKLVCRVQVEAVKRACQREEDLDTRRRRGVLPGWDALLCRSSVRNCVNSANHSGSDDR